MAPDMFWSYLAMPIGVAICFGPAMIVGLLFDNTPDPDATAAKEKSAGKSAAH
jgi:hypothetical protein